MKIQKRRCRQPNYARTNEDDDNDDGDDNQQQQQQQSSKQQALYHSSQQNSRHMSSSHHYNSHSASHSSISKSAAKHRKPRHVRKSLSKQKRFALTAATSATHSAHSTDKKSARRSSEQFSNRRHNRLSHSHSQFYNNSSNNNKSNNSHNKNHSFLSQSLLHQQQLDNYNNRHNSARRNIDFDEILRDDNENIRKMMLANNHKSNIVDIDFSLPENRTSLSLFDSQSQSQNFMRCFSQLEDHTNTLQRTNPTTTDNNNNNNNNPSAESDHNNKNNNNNNTHSFNNFSTKSSNDQASKNSHLFEFPYDQNYESMTKHTNLPSASTNNACEQQQPSSKQHLLRIDQSNKNNKCTRDDDQTERDENNQNNNQALSQHQNHQSQQYTSTRYPKEVDNLLFNPVDADNFMGNCNELEEELEEGEEIEEGEELDDYVEEDDNYEEEDDDVEESDYSTSSQIEGQKHHRRNHNNNHKQQEHHRRNNYHYNNNTHNNRRSSNRHHSSYVESPLLQSEMQSGTPQNDTSSSEMQETPSSQSYLPSMEQQLAAFAMCQEDQIFEFDTDDRMIMHERERTAYRIDANALLNYRGNFTNFPKKRAILLDWMQEVSSSLCFKRETYQQSIGMVDRYFQAVQYVPKNKLQLVGATALLIAHKIETLSFCLSPPSTYFWMNELMTQWDTFCEEYGQLFDTDCIYFKRNTQESFRLFVSVCQYIDCAFLDIKVHLYSSKSIIACFMYWALYQTIDFEAHPVRISFLDQIFDKFLAIALDVGFHDLLPQRQFTFSYISLSINMQLPQPRNSVATAAAVAAVAAAQAASAAATSSDSPNQQLTKQQHTITSKPAVTPDHSYENVCSQQVYNPDIKRIFGL